VRIGFAALGVVLLVLIVLSLLDMSRLIGALHTQVDRLDPAAVSGQDLSRSLLDQETGVRGYVLTGKEDFLGPYVDGQQQESIAVASLMRLIGSDSRLGRDVAVVERSATLWRTQSAQRMVDAVRSGRSDVASDEGVNAMAKQQFDAVRSGLETLQRDLDGERRAARHRLHTATADLVALLTLAGVGVVAGAFAIAGAFTWWVSRPLRTIAEEVRVVAGGDLDHAVDVSGPRDLVELAADVEAMRQRIVTELEAAVRSREALTQRGELVLRLREGLAPSGADVPSLPHAARLIPAEGVLAGDFYDVCNLGDGEVGLIVVDVAGHGADAGLFAYRLKALLSSSLRSGMDPAGVLAWTARQLGETGERFATAFIAVIQTATGVGKYASAGHPPPLVLARSGISQLPPTGPLLGPLEAHWRTDRFELEDQGLLVTFTDGLIEARSPSGAEFGVRRLSAVVKEHRHAGPDAMVDAAVAAVRAHVGGNRLADDCTVVILGWPDRRRVEPAASPRVERRGRGGLRAVKPARPMLEVHLVADASGIELARALVHQALEGTRWRRRAEAVERAIAEIMTLGARRAGTVATVRVDGEGQQLRCLVRGMPVAAGPGGEAEGDPSDDAGGGLPAVSAVADSWGREVEEGATTVWFVVAAERA